ncbi:SgcJ/EcaC family oxidoreductase [Thermomonospora amylolytica]|uniref:SgcJ/EcaC family oxidoreductase n=1 Tax=Thermomonospora amylolytica TaxID=1411117 RepID=UPI000E6C45B1|nr:SgcJ/EcaC family oxidoreductase [Thermomonospora amylolytica]
MTISTTTSEQTTPGQSAGKTTHRRPRRRVKRVLGVAALTFGMAAGGAYLWLDSTSDVRNTGNPDCAAVTPTGTPAADGHRQVCAVLSSMTDAWGRGDADAYGAVFTEDATYTTFVGSHYQGRHDIVESHRALFGGFLKGTRLADSYLSIRFYGPTTAIVTTRGDTYKGKPKKPGELSKTQTYTLIRQDDGQWRIAAFHNTKRQRVMERISFLFDPDTKPAAEK